MEKEIPKQNNEGLSRQQKIENFLLNPDKEIFNSLEEFKEAVDYIKSLVGNLDLNELENIQGEDGKNPELGVDYLTDEDLDKIDQFIQDRINSSWSSYPTKEEIVSSIDNKVNSEVAKIPRVKGEPGTPGEPGKDGSPDTAEKILEKLRALPKNKKLTVSDVRGLQNELNKLAQDQESSIEDVLKVIDSLRISIPILDGGIKNLTGLIQQGANITITGAGTTTDPYIINSSGTGNVFGPASAFADNFASFNDTTGKIIKDSGKNASSFDVAGAAAAITPSTLGLVIGINVLAQRTFGTAANNNTGDFATSAQGTLANNAVPNTRTVNTKQLNANIILNPDDLDDTTTTHKFVASTDITNWNTKQPALGFTAVPNTRTVNSKALSADIIITKSDVVLGNVDNIQQMPLSYLDIDGTLSANSDVKVASQKATKTYIDQLALGFVPKPSAHAATTATLPANTYNNGASGVGATLTAVMVGVLVIDGITIALNDYVLVKNESLGYTNGLYLCTTAGAVGVAYILTRDITMNQSTEFSNSLIVVEFGTFNAGLLWLCSNNGSVTVGTTVITFTNIPTAGAPIAGTGISITGNTVSIDTNVTVDKTTAQTLTNKTVNGITPTTMAFVDPTSSIQTQLNSKQASGAYLVAADIAGKANLASPTFTGTVTLPTGSTTVPALKMVAGVKLTSAQIGAFEFDGTNLFFTI